MWRLHRSVDLSLLTSLSSLAFVLESDQLQLTGKLLQAVLAEAQAVCIGQPLLIAGDVNADLAVIPVFLRVLLLDGMLIWPLLILSVLVLLLMLLVGLVGRVVLVHVGISLLAVLVLLLLLKLAMLLIGGLLLFSYCTFSY